MKKLILILLVVIGFCVDECQQLTTYEKCIGIKHLQCSWTGQYCETSHNYLIGCDKHLSLKLCTKQIGDVHGKISYCVFNDYCHTIYDSHRTKCTDQVNKFGCLSITNPSQLCKWEFNKCVNLSNHELASINQIFPDLELSASTCGLISGYLIIHYQLLWDLFEYQPDLEALALNQENKDKGIEIQTQTNYNETQQLQDNYIKNKYFVWFTTPTLLTPVNLKINDFTRCGCIAQEILNQSRYLMLFNLSGLIRGANHIYCNYLNMHPKNPRFTVYSNYECKEVTESELQQNQYQCTQLGKIECQLYYNPQNKCKIDLNSEYQCQDIATIPTPSSCETLLETATHFHCSLVESEACYLNTSSREAYCSKQCSLLKNQDFCEQNTDCIWLGNNLNSISDSYLSKFTVCGPKNSCDQLGLNRFYCLQLADNCLWDEINFRCKFVNNIEQLLCKDCNSLYCCSSIIRYDQHCIWNNEKCLNVKDSPLFSHFLSFPTNVTMNKNLCVSQTGQQNYYQIETRTCQTNGINLYSECILFDDPNFDTDNFFCNNGVNDRINKEYCLSLANSYTRWNYFKQRCVHVTNTQLPCDTLQQVNPILCSKAITQQNKMCLYNPKTFSCYSSDIIDIHCDTQGISKQQCLEQYELCQWVNNVCSFVWPHQINLLKCSELIFVSPRVCELVQRGTDQCIYDNIQQSCTVIYSSLPNCNGYQNQIACRSSNSMCYFDNVTLKCSDSSQLLNILKCDIEFINHLTCISITTFGQSCYWGSTKNDRVQKCRTFVPDTQAECESLKGFANINQCARFQIANYFNPNENQYCEVVNQVCTSNITPINDCGSDRIINIHRCMGYTQGDCYFNNFKCIQLNGTPELQSIILQSLTCNQVNMNLCNRVLTPGQSCYKQSTIKCNIYNPIKIYTCSQLADYDMSIYGPQLCIIASDECYYNYTKQKCDQPIANTKFDCSQIGASKRLCIAFTIGQCVFQDNFCQQMNDLNIECQYRNQKACSSGGLSCSWNIDKQLCSLSTMDCPAIYNGESSWPICGLSTKDCIPGQNGCIEYFTNDIPCWVALSQTLCEAQRKYCQWINNKCTSFNYQCEDSISIGQCVQHRYSKCVFANNKCFEVKQQANCDDFEYTTLQFCSQFFPKCIYKNYTCQQVNFVNESKQKDEVHLIYGDFQDQISQIDCLLQRSDITIFYKFWSYQYCGTDEYQLEYCEYFDENYLPSMLYCESAPECQFSMTLSATPFCYTYPLSCEQLPYSFCTLDIPGINCYLDDMGYCLTFTDELTCENVAGLQVNRQLCVDIMLNSQETSCYYQSNTQLCKILNPDIANDCESQSDIFQCTFINNSCLNTNDPQPCVSYSDYDQNLNLYGCTQLTTDNYYFNLNTYTCDSYQSTNDIIIYSCQQFNQLSCVSSGIEIKCVWEKSICTEQLIQQLNIDCQFRNKQACLNSSTINCMWKISTNQCVTGDNLCNQTECLYSEAYCISIDQLWNSFNCYSYPSEPTSFFQCSHLGLNEQWCLNNTQNLTCYWDGLRCLEANLITLECSANVSQQTCLQITNPNQVCKWQDQKCITIENSTICNDYITLRGCKLAPISCQFNIARNQCREKNDVNYSCFNTLSFNACKNVENEYCTWVGYQCEQWERRKYSCDQIVNKWGCYNTKMYCQWTTQCENIGEIESMACQSIPQTFNKISCTKYSNGPCLFDEATQKCDIKLTSSFSDAMNADQSLFTQIRLIYECTQFVNQDDCIQSRIGFCDWQDNQCINCEIQNCQNYDCNNHNQNQCLSLNQECAWREDNCVSWLKNDNITLIDLTLVTEKCCTQYNMLIKYDIKLASCVPLDTLNDDCLSYGLSKYACLHLSNSLCIYSNNQCSILTMTYLTKCSDYQNITQFVCQQIPHMSCKFDSEHFKCTNIDLQADICETQGISKLGCTQITLQPCYWNNNNCSKFTVDAMIDQCDNNTITNSNSCSLLNYHSVCSFNYEYQTCQHRFNRYSLCDEPGLNKIACFQIIREPCQYVNGQCTKVTQLNISCQELSNVNELACKMNIMDSCAYDSISNNCYYTLQKLPCSFPGLNQNSCLKQFCQWSADDQTCFYKQPKQICQLSREFCQKTDICKYEGQTDTCRVKECDDLIDCKGSMNGKLCYQNYNQSCQAATKCEDIVNLIGNSSCTDFAFFGSTCIQILNYCVSATNFNEICINSDCSNNFCKMYNSICQPLQCLDQDDCKESCSIIDGICENQSTCSVIDDQQQCINSFIDGFQCQWLRTGIYENRFHCTNSYCQLYKVSSSLCNGNEINQRSCFMNTFQQCTMCEEIKDESLCSNSSGACKYINGQCYSILCESFLEHDKCQQSQKCYWSMQDSVCRKFCYQIITQEECEALNYECQWNYLQDQCDQGVSTDVDLSKTITITSIDQASLLELALIYFIQW